MYLTYNPEQITRSILTNCRLIFIIIMSLSNVISICTNIFGMSDIITSLFFFESIPPVVMIASNAAVRLVSSSQKM